VGDQNGRKDAIDSKGRDGTLDLRMQGPSMRMCEVVMMRVFIDKCVVMVVEIAKAKRKENTQSRVGPVNGIGPLRGLVRS